MIAERVSGVGHVHLVQSNLDIKFCDTDSKSGLDVSVSGWGWGGIK